MASSTQKLSLSTRLLRHASALIGDVPPVLAVLNVLLLVIVAVMHPLLAIGSMALGVVVAAVLGTLDARVK